MGMPGRKYSLANTNYRYGFNGKENDNEVKGEGNQQDYGMRIYDSRLGRFLSVDPVSHLYPMLSSYQFASNSPIANLDLDGLESLYYNTTINFIQHYQAMPDGSTKSWSTQEISGDPVGMKTGIYPNGKLGSGTLYTISTQVKEVFLNVNGIVQSHCEEKPIVTKNIYVRSEADIMKTDVTKRPMFKGKFQLIIYGSAHDDSESPGERMNPNAQTESINIGAFNDILKPIILGLDVKMSPDGPTLEDIVSDHTQNAIEKAEILQNKNNQLNQRTTKVCPNCMSGDRQPEYGADAYLIDENDKVTDTLKRNPQTGNVDTLNGKKEK
jgi:RHS repeat-associated protein